MNKQLLGFVILTLAMALAACAGSTAPVNPGDGGNLPELTYNLVTDPSSTVAAADVTGEMTAAADALSARRTSALPAGFIPVQAMYFSPEMLPGAGFLGSLSVEISMGDPAPAAYDGVRLFLFLVHPQTLEAIPLDSSRAIGNWVTFDLNALGYLVIAENSSIPRPGTVFTVSAFADLALAQVGTMISFWAHAQNGTPPYAFAWNFGDGSQAGGSEASHSFTLAGEYVVELVVTDSTGRSALAASTPIVISDNPTPLDSLVVVVTPDPANPLLFSFNATVSGGNPPLNYQWDFDGDASVDSTSGAQVQHEFAQHDLYLGLLTVSDQLGAEVSAEFIVDARRLTLESDTTFGPAPYSASFSLSLLGIGTDDTVEIDFDNGDVLADPEAEFDYEFTAPGVYNVVAKATRDVNGEAVIVESDPVEVVVTDTPNPQIAAMSPASGPVGTMVTVIGAHFGDEQAGNQVTLAGLEQQVDSWSDSHIEFTVVAGSVDGDVVVIRDGQQSNARVFTVLPRAPGGPGGEQL